MRDFRALRARLDDALDALDRAAETPAEQEGLFLLYDDLLRALREGLPVLRSLAPPGREVLFDQVEAWTRPDLHAPAEVLMRPARASAEHALFLAPTPVRVV